MNSWKLTYPQLLPKRRPEGHVPRAPRWNLTFSEPVSIVTSDYLGIQVRSWDSLGVQAFLDTVRLTHQSQGSYSPEAWELLSCVDDAGLLNIVHLAYWKNPTQHERWVESSELGRWYGGLDAKALTFGAWHEVIEAAFDHTETVYSNPRRPFGLAALNGTHIEPMDVNGYFGAARDRIPVSAIDPLAATSPQPAPTPKNSLGRKLRVECNHNMAVIRSGQYWADAGSEQLADYVGVLEPKLTEGMNYLRRHKNSTGTLSLRIMTSLDKETYAPRRETSIFAYFHNLSNLEDWAANHATHHKIYEHAIEKNREYGENREVTTWHEVFILTKSARFEYVNCNPSTGLLPYATCVLSVE